MGVWVNKVPSYPPIAVLRHGETEWNTQHRLQGRFDSPLTPKGIAHARAQRVIVSDFLTPDCTVIASPQPRALHTAALVCAGTDHVVRTDDQLCEIDIGGWVGLHSLEVKRRVQDRVGPLPGVLDYHNHTPGEDFVALRQRCTAFLGSLTGPTLIVTHGITSRMIRLVATGADTSSIADLPGGQGVVHMVRDGVHDTLVGENLKDPSVL